MAAKIPASHPLARQLATQAGVVLKKPHKYHAKKTVVGDITFPSKREANRYGELLVMLKAGYITDLELQKRFEIKVNGIPICVYIADFSYFEIKDGRWIVEDAKGLATEVFKLKKRLMLAANGIEVVEV